MHQIYTMQLISLVPEFSARTWCWTSWAGLAGWLTLLDSEVRSPKCQLQFPLRISVYASHGLVTLLLRSSIVATVFSMKVRVYCLPGLKNHFCFLTCEYTVNENMKTKSSLTIFPFNKIIADLGFNIKLGWKDKASSAFEEFKCVKDTANKLPLLKSYIEVDQKTKSNFLKISGLQEIEEMGWCGRGVGCFSKWTPSPWHL